MRAIAVKDGPADGLTVDERIPPQFMLVYLDGEWRADLPPFMAGDTYIIWDGEYRWLPRSREPSSIASETRERR